MKITAIDFETANGSPASVCAVGVSVMEDGAVEEKYETLIRPEENVGRFSPANIAIHGITPEQTADAPRFPEVYAHLQDYFDDAIITAHNASFDMGCLKAACLNTGRPIPCLEYFDTVELSRQVFRDLPHHRLDDMCDYLHVQLNHHNALSDSYGCLLIVTQVMNLTGVFEIRQLLEQCNTRIHEL